MTMVMLYLLVTSLSSPGLAVRPPMAVTGGDNRVHGRDVRRPADGPLSLDPRRGKSLAGLQSQDNSTISVISLTERTLADDWQNQTGAILTDPVARLPGGFTWCVAVTTPAFGDFVTFGTLLGADGNDWFSLDVRVGYEALQTTYEVWFKYRSINLDSTTAQLFPLEWTRACLALDSQSGLVRVVVDGTTLVDGDYQELREQADTRPTTLTGMYFGYFYSDYSISQFSNLQVFSSVLPVARMSQLTSPGSGECGAPGDYTAWQDTVWSLTGEADTQKVFWDEPCNQPSAMHVYMRAAEFLSQAKTHCSKLGGRMPPVTTEEEYTLFRKEVERITYDRLATQHFLDEYSWFGVYVPITDADSEREWLDIYTGSIYIHVYKQFIS